MIVLERNPLDSLANLGSLAMSSKRGYVFARRHLAPFQQSDLSNA